MDIKEKYNLEFKEKVTKTFLKTVSAYSNYNDGEIIFGIADNGDFKEIGNTKDECLVIENMINDSINPVPEYTLNIQQFNGNTVIVLNVKKGKDTPYNYNGKAYRRSDSATLEVDRFELRRLAIEGLNMGFEDKKASSQSLSFQVLESKLRETVGIDKISLDILKTLNLYNNQGYYNVAGELLADKNDINFSGIDIVRFGDSINQILYRETISKISLLAQYERAMEIFEIYYQYEQIEGYKRVKKELVPKEAFREAVANAIVHRVWDVNSYIKIAMDKKGIEVTSPGGLPAGISEDEYLYCNISILRNPIISSVFYRLNIIEKFGTGIARINKEYMNSITKPDFSISNNFIKIKLPVMNIDVLNLSKDEIRIYKILKDENEISRKELEERLGFNKSKSVRVIKSLIEKNIIKRNGDGPSITYKLI